MFRSILTNCLVGYLCKLKPLIELSYLYSVAESLVSLLCQTFTYLIWGLQLKDWSVEIMVLKIRVYIYPWTMCEFDRLIGWTNLQVWSTCKEFWVQPALYQRNSIGYPVFVFLIKYLIIEELDHLQTRARDKLSRVKLSHVYYTYMCMSGIFVLWMFYLHLYVRYNIHLLLRFVFCYFLLDRSILPKFWIEFELLPMEGPSCEQLRGWTQRSFHVKFVIYICLLRHKVFSLLFMI